MRRIFLLANLYIAFGLTAPRILFAESGLIFDQAQGTLYGQLNVPTTAAAGLTVSSSAYLAISGGKVGIGTAAPGAKLHIIDGSGELKFQNVSQENLYVSGINASVIVDAIGSSYPSYFIKAGGVAQAQLAADTAGLSLFAGGTTNGIRVLNSGNVGIGTTGPTAKPPHPPFAIPV